jgi:tRNA A-37 threonylcarbamoyl transferase component Bud32
MAASIALPCPDEAESSFERWWSAQGEWVEPPNVRRDGESGVQRIKTNAGARALRYCKRQVGHLYRSLRHPLGRPTVLREHDALQAFSQLGVRVPTIVYCGARQQAGRWQALLVTEELKGFVSLEHWYEAGLDERHGRRVHEQMLKAVGQTLSRYHRGRWQHGCCYAKHIFIKAAGQADASGIEIAVLDLEKSRRRLGRRAAVEHDMRQLARHRGAMSDDDWQLLQAAHAAALDGELRHGA